MRVKSISINNFRGIRSMELQFQPDVNVLVGENGAGKSSTLEVIAILLSRLMGRIGSSTGTGRFFSELDIKNGTTETSNTIVINFLNKEVEWRVARTKKGRKKQTISNLRELNDIVDDVHEGLERDEKTNVPLAVFYSVNRAVLDVPLRIRKNHDFSQIGAYDQALTGKKSEGRNDFKLFFEWFRNREDIENENARYRNSLMPPNGWEFPDRQLEAVRKAIKVFMPGYDNLRVRRVPMRMILEKKGHELRVDQLSDGEKCLIALIGDLARRLAIANPAMKNPHEASGIILIDEIDLHLHPSWQRMVIPNLLKTFPNCQFIVSTHSPQIISHVKSENIYLLREVEDNVEWAKPDTSFGQECGRILEDIMDVPNRPLEIKSELNNLFVAIDEGKLKKAHKIHDRLRKQIGTDPELSKAAVLIKRKERIGK